MQLRSYQESAKRAVYEHLRSRDDNPLVVIPTAGGKTPLMASICKDAVSEWGGRVLILAHVRELLQQAAEKLHAACPELPFGVYSAGLNRRDTAQEIIVAGIQSIYQRASELGAFDLALIDEAHLIPPEGDGMYRRFLADARRLNPRLRIIGFTATPFRLNSGSLCSPEGFLNAICFEIGVGELIRDGYLCPLITKAGKVKADTRGLHVRHGEFIADEVEALMDQGALVQAACAEIVDQTHDRHACLLFASSIAHGEHLVRVLAQQQGVECGFVCGNTPTPQRDETLHRFRCGQLKYLCNVNVLTTGFDVARIDCVALLRPTLSPGLYYQMVGRGFRLHPGKENCLVLDFGGNVLRHGPVDQVTVSAARNGKGPAPVKECPECQSLIATGYARCPDCGQAFPPRQPRRCAAQASGAPILSEERTITRHAVQKVFYSIHTKRGASPHAPKTLRVDYRLALNKYQSEWICLEHRGYPRQKAIGWWKRRSAEPVPHAAAEALVIAQDGKLANTRFLTLRKVAGEPYGQILDYELEPIPELVFCDVAAGCDPAEIPF
jgi:DNA repair protein RadD